MGVFHHRGGFVHCPVAERIAIAHHGKPLVGAELGRTHLQHHGVAVGGGRSHKQLTVRTTFSERRTVEITVFGIVDPVVESGDFSRLSGREVEAVCLYEPLTTHHIASTLHAVVVVERISRIGGGSDFATPVTTIYGAHGISLRSAVGEHIEHDFFTKNRLIFNYECQFHFI